MDRRLTPANARAALESLRGKVDAPRFVAGEAASVAVPLADLLKAPAGGRDRQVIRGEAVTVIDRHEGWAFVQAAKDGFCGYLREDQLGGALAATHWVATPGTHLYDGPKVQHRELAALHMHARVQVTGMQGNWAETPQGFVPAMHLKPLGQFHDDPASVAQMFLRTPYLWGGNSRAGIDCSGLAQGAFLACGIPLPGDSDLQSACGTEIPEGAPLQRDDLLFWKGHVAIALSPSHMIHATAAYMAVVEEETEAAIARIIAGGDGPVTGRRRLG
ncbi:C40 family peptidase [Gemmobacter serpentinus]|uniref:C40 family peptidase n=1 Tax=Gemmobacter serpentinus TaxID=2652247 RepID=UPI00124DB0AF|nr:NlpC/P60 family protein [Gemmobacter serpentinus]